ncbi:MAG: hypothetical protein LBK94_04300 [Prevotellaceae bacterium]|nr:hypothetical protein [Prevotellaceae bacterium]
MECAEVKKQQDSDDFAFRHRQGTIPVPFDIAGLDLEIFEFFGKFLSEIVYNTENFGNFVRGKYAHVILLFN